MRDTQNVAQRVTARHTDAAQSSEHALDARLALDALRSVPCDASSDTLALTLRITTAVGRVLDVLTCDDANDDAERARLLDAAREWAGWVTQHDDTHTRVEVVCERVTRRALRAYVFAEGEVGVVA